MGKWGGGGGGGGGGSKNFKMETPKFPYLLILEDPKNYFIEPRK